MCLYVSLLLFVSLSVLRILSMWSCADSMLLGGCNYVNNMLIIIIINYYKYKHVLAHKVTTDTGQPPVSNNPQPQVINFS